MSNACISFCPFPPQSPVGLCVGHSHFWVSFSGIFWDVSEKDCHLIMCQSCFFISSSRNQSETGTAICHDLCCCPITPDLLINDVLWTSPGNAWVIPSCQLSQPRCCKEQWCWGLMAPLLYSMDHSWGEVAVSAWVHHCLGPLLSTQQ